MKREKDRESRREERGIERERQRERGGKERAVLEMWSASEQVWKDFEIEKTKHKHKHVEPQLIEKVEKNASSVFEGQKISKKSLNAILNNSWKIFKDNNLKLFLLALIIFLELQLHSLTIIILI